MVTLSIILICLSALVRIRITLSPFDPLNMVYVKECIMVLTLVQGLNSYVPNDFFYLFVISYCSWIILLGVASIYAMNYRKSVDVFFSYIERDTTSLKIITILYVVVLAIFVVYGYGSGGDQRLSLFKKLRIFEPFIIFAQILVFYKYLFKYLESKSLLYLFIIIILLVPNFLIGGKSAVFIILFCFNYLLYRKHFELSGLKLAVLVAIVFSGIFISLRLNYGGDQFDVAFKSLLTRVQNDSDIYFMYFRDGFGAYVEVESGIKYLFGPIFKLIGLGHLVSTNIGAQLSTVFWEKVVITGPNAHLPFVLDALDSIESRLLTMLVFLAVPISLQVFMMRTRSSLFLTACLPVLYIFIFNRYFFDPPAYTLLLLELFIFYVCFAAIRYICWRREL